VPRPRVEARRVSTAHDGREPLERRIDEAKVPDEGIEAALLALVAEVHILDVVGDRVSLLRGLQHFLCGHVHELGFRIDKPRNEPGARDAVDLRPLARSQRVLAFSACESSGPPAAFQPSPAPLRGSARRCPRQREPLAAFWLTS